MRARTSVSGVLLAALIVPSAGACPIGKSGPSKKDQDAWRKAAASKPQAKRKIASDGEMPVLPSLDSNQPWGGSDQQKWKPEAVLANAVSRALNAAWKQAGVEDVLVSVPVRMIPTKERPYGDGQTNATLEFGSGWKAREPQLVMTMVKKGGKREVEIWFSPSVTINDLKATITATADRRIDETIALTKSEDGYRGRWKVPDQVTFGNLEAPRVAWIRPAGWDSSFPVDFRFPVYKNTELAKAAGPAKSAGKPALDPMDILKTAKASKKVVQDVLKETRFGPEWVKNDRGGDYFEVDNIHAYVPSGKTAVGGGHTWVIGRGPNSTFKNLYTCFDQRNFDREKEDGVPSGGGWHEIGDAAETIMNSVEEAPVLVGHATGVPFQPPPDGAKFAWNLTDVATIRFLKPGEGMMTAAGKTTWEEDRAARDVPGSYPDWGKSKRGSDTSGTGRNYHWFAFQSEQPTCTQEWVHICRPTTANGFGLAAGTGSECTDK